ncbi:MAG: alpha/beta hydrolase [Gemmobacter sp.]
MRESPYRTLIDAPTWAFIDRTNAAYPADATALDIAGQRRVYDAMCAVFRAPRPAGVAVSDAPRGGMPTRRYGAGPSGATVVYFHGGGFLVGGLESHDDVCAELCAATGLRVISVDYRLAPEHRHPAAFDDAMAATRAVAEAYGPVILAGDSAGGTLASSVTHALRGSPVRVLGQVLIYPGMGAPTDRGSYVTHAHAPMLTTADILNYRRLRHGRDDPPPDPTAAALQDSDFTGLPPTAIFAAECDPHADAAGLYRDRIRAAGGCAEATVEPGLVHGYLRARHSVPRARASFDRITAALAAMATGEFR